MISTLLSCTMALPMSLSSCTFDKFQIMYVNNYQIFRKTTSTNQASLPFRLAQTSHQGARQSVLSTDPCEADPGRPRKHDTAAVISLCGLIPVSSACACGLRGELLASFRSGHPPKGELSGRLPGKGPGGVVAQLWHQKFRSVWPQHRCSIRLCKAVTAIYDSSASQGLKLADWVVFS